MARGICITAGGNSAHRGTANRSLGDSTVNLAAPRTCL